MTKQATRVAKILVLFLILGPIIQILPALAGGLAGDAVIILNCEGLLPSTPDCANDTLQPFETLIYDNDGNSDYSAGDFVIVGPFPVLGVALSDEPSIRYRDANGDNIWGGSEPVFYDADGNFTSTSDRIFLVGTPTLLVTLVKDDPSIKFADSNGNGLANGIVRVTARLERMGGPNNDGSQEDADAIQVIYNYDPTILQVMRVSYPSGAVLPDSSRFSSAVRTHCQSSGSGGAPLDSVIPDETAGRIQASHLCTEGPPRTDDVGIGCDPSMSTGVCPGDPVTGGPMQNLDVLNVQFMVLARGNFPLEHEIDAPGNPGTKITDIDVTATTTIPLSLVNGLFNNGPAGNQPPIARFTYSPSNPTVNQAVTFDGSTSTDLDGMILDHSWNFGDGGGANGPLVTHAYSSFGSYPVTLTVRDEGGASSLVTQTVAVSLQGLNLIQRDGWTIFWQVSQSDGIALSNVTFNGTPVLEDARLPGILVTYVGSSCFFYDELLDYETRPQQIFIEDSPFGGFRVRADYDVPGYLYQQIWEFLPDGTFLGLLEIGGGGCFAPHTYQARWRYDFSLGGNNTISAYDGSSWNSVGQESELHDSGVGDPSRIDTIWEVSGNQSSYSFVPIDTPEEPATPGTLLALFDRAGEIERTHDPRTETPRVFLNNEMLNGQDAAFWYLSDHFHNVTEGITFEAPVYTGLVFYPSAGRTPSFRTSADPDSLTINPGDSATSTITLNSLAGFEGNVTLTIDNPSASLSTNSAFIGANGTFVITLTITTTVTTLPGTHAVTVLGISHPIHRWAIVQFTVPSSPPPPPEPSPYTKLIVPHKFVGAGTPQGFQADDQSWQIALNFTFPFYQRQFTSIWVSSNGLITFLSPDSRFDNSITGLANIFAIAVLWDDLMTINRSGADIYLSYPDPNHFAIRWQAVTFGTLYAVDFEAVLGADGTIQFNYGPSTGPVSATVGISNGAGDIIAEDISNSNLIQSIIFTLATGPDFLLAADPSSLTFDAGESAQSTVTLRSIRGFTGVIDLTANVDPSAPDSLIASLSSQSVALEANQTVTLTLTVSSISSTAAGFYTVTVTGTNGTVEHSASISVHVAVQGLLPFRDEFDYLNINEMQNAGWVLCGGAPLSYHYFSNGVLALENDGTVGGAVCWSNIPEGVSDWTVTTRVKWFANSVGSLGLAVWTTQHFYLWQADGYYGRFDLQRDGQWQPPTLVFPGYQRQLDVWHEMRLDMQSGLLSMFFDGQLIGTYEETSPGTLTQVGLPSQWLTHNAFDYVEVRELEPVPDFRISANPSTLTLEAGAIGLSDITLTSVNGFVGDVSLTALFSPSVFNASARLDPKSLGLGSNGTAVSALTIFTGDTTPPGNYALVVTATSGSLSHSIQITVTVTPPPNRPPVSTFTYSPGDPRTGDFVGFDGSGSFDSDGFIVSWSWNFGDGSFSSGTFVGHSYFSPGVYTVTLTVTDNRGGMASSSQSITVRSRPQHDVGVDDIQVSPSDRLVSGQLAVVTVVVENQGIQEELVTVRAYYDGTLIGTLTQGVYGSPFYTYYAYIQVFWDTSNVPPGQYLLSADVQIAVDEDSSNNFLEDGIVTVLPPPVLEVSPSEGSLGTKVTVTGSGLPSLPLPGGVPRPVLVSFDSQFLGYTFTTNDRFQFTFNIPEAQPGHHTINALDVLSFLRISTSITVVDTAALELGLDTGSLYFEGDTAVATLQVLKNGQRIEPTSVHATLTLPNGSTQTLNLQRVEGTTGLYRIEISIPSRNSVGTYTINVDASYQTEIVDSEGHAIKAFTVKTIWLSSRRIGTLSATGSLVVGVGLIVAAKFGVLNLKGKKTKEKVPTRTGDNAIENGRGETGAQDQIGAIPHRSKFYRALSSMVRRI